MSIKIITDSTIDLDLDSLQAWDVEMAPLTVQFGIEEYTDGIDLSREAFYKKLETFEALPTTSQVSVGRFMTIFQSVLEKDDEVIGIFISSELSGTYQSAVIAKETLGIDRIHLIDSKNVTMGLAILVAEAVKLRDAGLCALEMVAELERLKEKIRLIAAIGQLKYLQKGGRLSSGTAAVGTLLSIKPIIEVKNGRVELVHKARGFKGAYRYLLEELKQSKIDTARTICYGHTHAAVELEKLKKQSASLINGKVMELEIGPVVGTHAGPGAVGLAFFLK